MLVSAFALLLATPAHAEPVGPRQLVTEYASLANITYAVAGGTELKLDVYRPRTVGAPRPTLVFIHGGGWVSGAKEDAVLWLVPWLEAGWSAVNVEYRLSREAHAPAAVEDVRCALRWVARYAAGPRLRSGPHRGQRRFRRRPPRVGHGVAARHHRSRPRMHGAVSRGHELLGVRPRVDRPSGGGGELVRHDRCRGDAVRSRARGDTPSSGWDPGATAKAGRGRSRHWPTCVRECRP